MKTLSSPIYPCLWFNHNAKEAAEFYCTVFENSRIISESPIVVMFEINGQQMMGLNGGNKFTFNEATSFVIPCDTQDEIDYYWSALTQDGTESMCGWLNDKFGVSWQVVPSFLGKLMSHPTNGKRVMEAFLKMKKFDVELLMTIANS
ncbi:MAG TPA: VOC family protein [Chitinophagaceae bacterium]|nr:VOC family protein [Chitinophagaceae bacterium]